MLKSKIARSTALALSMSLLMSVPVYAGSGNWQSVENNMNAMQTQQNMMQTNGQLSNSLQNNRNAMQPQQNMIQTNGQLQQNMIQTNGQSQQSTNGQSQQNTVTQTSQQLGNAAQYMINQGIIKGDSSGNYAMSNNVKRGDMSLMLIRAFHFNTQSATNGNFSDVSQGSYYYDAINTMKSLSIAQGDGQNFNPNNNMTLQEAISFVERALNSAGYDCSDIDLYSLFEDRSLSDNATREDVSTILYAALGDDIETNVITSAAILTCETDENDAIIFDEDAFNDVCQDATSEDLSYVKLTLPSTSYGVLYYGYDSSTDYDSAVTASDEYYFDADDDQLSISDITFVPKTNYIGPVNIRYTGYNVDGDSYTGTVRITVNKNDITFDTITYETDSDTAITFDEDDFNDVCQDATDADISYVKFSLPSTSYGKLYYNYESSSDYDSTVTASGKYYYDADDDELSISDITFVPNDDYTGTAKINYTGYDVDGNSFTGTVKISID